MKAPELGPEMVTNPGARTRELKRLVTIKKVEISTMVAVVGLLFGFGKFLLDDSRRNTADLKGAYEKSEERHEKVHQEIKQETRELRLDVRDLSRQQQTGRTPPRLTKPLEPISDGPP